MSKKKNGPKNNFDHGQISVGAPSPRTDFSGGAGPTDRFQWGRPGGAKKCQKSHRMATK